MPFKRWPKSTSWSISSSTPSSADVVDQPLSHQPNQRVAAQPVIQSPPHIVVAQANLIANESLTDVHPIT